MTKGQTQDPWGTWRVSVWSIIAAFGAYFCMYGFRKPFTVAPYDEAEIFGMGFKEMAVTVQVFGYMLSKFIGIKVISEMPPARRAISLLCFIGLAHLALLLFAVLPPPWNLVGLFLNGLPLGMVFGLVLGFLEGRGTTEALVAGLCASFILADGVVKWVGAEILQWGVANHWMPFAAGAVFLGPFLGFVWMLARIPAPTEADQSSRSPRTPMTAEDRGNVCRRHAVGLGAVISMYLAITILRSVRADFAPEIWQGLKAEISPAVYAQSEWWVALGVTLLTGFAVVVRRNEIAFFLSLLVALGGSCLVVIAVLAQRMGWLEPFAFMVLGGFALYLPYVAVHATIFERWIALTRDRGNMGFLMYLADSIGYLGYVAVILFRSAAAGTGDFLRFYHWMSLGLGLVAVACLTVALVHFLPLLRNARRELAVAPLPIATSETVAR